MASIPSNPTGGAPPAPGARLHLISAHPSKGPHSSTLDGAWWPRSRELTRELPLLVDEFAELGIAVSHFVYNPTLWLIAPTKVHVRGRKVHLGWVREIDPNLITLSTSQDECLRLLVIPPEASADIAARASEVAVEPGNHSPAEVLANAAVVDIAELS